MNTNLLPFEFQFQIQLRKYLRFWGRVWLACGLLVAMQCGWSTYKVHRAELLAQTPIQQSHPIANQQQRTRELRVQLAALRNQMAATEELVPEDRTLPVLALIGHAIGSSEKEISISRFTLQSNPLLVSLHGMAADDRTISHFVSELRSCAVLSAVDLKASSEVSGAVQATRQFHVELRCDF